MRRKHLTTDLGLLLALAGCGGGGGNPVASDPVTPGTTDWSLGSPFTAPNADATNLFGYAIAVSADGQTLAVSAPQERSPALGVNGSQQQDAGAFRGAVYLYSRAPDGQWRFETYLKASLLLRGDSEPAFGSALSLSSDGNTLAVGARTTNGPRDGIGETSRIESGAVFVFNRAQDNTWAEVAILRASDGFTLDRLGSSVALSGDGRTIVAGAPQRDYGAVTGAPDPAARLRDSGAAYVFRLDASSQWRQIDLLRAPQPVAGDQFGHSVALSRDGNRIAVGAPRESGGGSGVVGSRSASSSETERTGAAYLFELRSDRYQLEAMFKPQQPQRYQAFGQSIALDATGSRLVVGGDFTGYAVQSGAGLIDYPPGFVDVFDRIAGQWQGAAILSEPQPRRNSDRFGFAVSLTPDGKLLAVGMSGDQLDVPTPELYRPRGAVHVFGHDGQWRHQAKITPADTDSRAQDLGYSVAVTADGRQILAGAAHADGTSPSGTTLTDSGRVYPLSRR